MTVVHWSGWRVLVKSEGSEEIEQSREPLAAPSFFRTRLIELDPIGRCCILCLLSRKFRLSAHNLLQKETGCIFNVFVVLG